MTNNVKDYKTTFLERSNNMIKKSIIEVNEDKYKIYKIMRSQIRKKYNLELGKWETYKSREYHVNELYIKIMRYHLAIFYNIGDRKFVEKCHSSPVVKVWHPLG